MVLRRDIIVVLASLVLTHKSIADDNASGRAIAELMTLDTQSECFASSEDLPASSRRRVRSVGVPRMAYLAALLMLAAVPARAADVKELFAVDLPDYPGKEGP